MPRTLREFIDLIANPMLVESRQQCEDMMSPLVKLADEIKEAGIKIGIRAAVQQEIDFAEKTFQRLQPKLWFIRIARIAISVKFDLELIRKETVENAKVDDWLIRVQLLTNRFKKDIVKTENTIGNSYSSLTNIKRQMTHFSGFPPEIFDNVVFGNRSAHDVILDMSDAEHKWKAKQVGLQPITNLGYVIKEFPDGMVWFDRVEGSCAVEGRAMGHCGNVGSAKPGDSLLSLRRKVTKGGKENWETFLTFIIDEYGYLGETKGRNNSKPATKFHPYIVALLKEDFVKGIKGGGWEPKNNFKIDDLSEEFKSDLFAAKPSMMPFDLRFKCLGMSEELADAVNRHFMANIGEEESYFEFAGWSDGNEKFNILEEGTNSSRVLYSIISDKNIDDDILGLRKYLPDEDDLVMFLNSLDEEQWGLFGFKDGDELERGEVTLDDVRFFDNTFLRQLTLSVGAGYDVSFQKQAQKHVMGVLNKHPYIKAEIVTKEHQRSGEIHMNAWITPERACEIAASEKLTENVGKNGWWGTAADMSERWLPTGDYDPEETCNIAVAVAKYLSIVRPNPRYTRY